MSAEMPIEFSITSDTLEPLLWKLHRMPDAPKVGTIKVFVRD